MFHLPIAALALIVERFTGYPKPLLDAVGHPVMWFGRIISAFEERLNHPERSDADRKNSGIFTVAALLLIVSLGSLLLLGVTRQFPFGWVLEALLATTLLAQSHLGEAVKAVADGLDVSLDEGRAAVSQIVGRDPEALDEAGVARAAIETLAENTSDGVVAPLFWLALFGLPGIALYKAINTANSMIGHMDERHRQFGWAAAKLDDVVNWIPARLTAALFVIAAFFTPGGSPGAALRAAERDAGKHASPNAGWPEAAMAGALGFALGGPRSYHGEMVDLPTMGEGRSSLGADDVRRALVLYWRALTALAVIMVVLVFAAWL